jgi:hypothetical protein
MTIIISLLGGLTKIVPADGALHAKTSAVRVILLLNKNE